MCKHKHTFTNKFSNKKSKKEWNGRKRERAAIEMNVRIEWTELALAIVYFLHIYKYCVCRKFYLDFNWTNIGIFKLTNRSGSLSRLMDSVYTWEKQNKKWTKWKKMSLEKPKSTQHHRCSSCFNKYWISE